MNLPIDYKKLLTNRVIIITGAGRSGTTILGKIIGSMEPAYYLFEPSIMKFCRDTETLRATIFEDYWLLQVQGRNLNLNNEDDSYIGNYGSVTGFTIRHDAIEECHFSKLVIKLSEYQPKFDSAREVFPGCKFVHIVRNGNDVVDSMCQRGWYTDEYMRTGFLDWVVDGAPWFINPQSQRLWSKWNPETRAACVWRRSTEIGFNESDNYDDIYPIDYGSLDAYSLSKWLRLEVTDLTRQHIKSIRKPTKHPDITDKIQEPERGRFLKLMGELGYGNLDNRAQG